MINLRFDSMTIFVAIITYSNTCYKMTIEILCSRTIPFRVCTIHRSDLNSHALLETMLIVSNSWR